MNYSQADKDEELFNYVREDNEEELKELAEKNNIKFQSEGKR